MIFCEGSCISFAGPRGRVRTLEKAIHPKSPNTAHWHIGRTAIRTLQEAPAGLLAPEHPGRAVLCLVEVLFPHPVGGDSRLVVQVSGLQVRESTRESPARAQQTLQQPASDFLLDSLFLLAPLLLEAQGLNRQLLSSSFHTSQLLTWYQVADILQKRQTFV